MVETRLPLNRYLGPYERHCAGAALAPGRPYVAAPVIGLGVVDRMLEDELSQIVAFDRAESEGANLTQANLVGVSSFCGPNGLLLGLDLLSQPTRPSPLVPGDARVCDATPLLEATQALLGTLAEPRFPVMPGEHVLCAYKAADAAGPSRLLAGLAIGVPKNRDRNAILFMECNGAERVDASTGSAERIARELVRSVDQVGQNLGVRYERVFVAVRKREVREGQIGCALTAVPYLLLPRQAVPEAGLAALSSMSCEQWLTSVERRSSDAWPEQRATT